MNWFQRIKSKRYFFGWENIKWFIREIRETFSNRPSYFSRKRIESFFLFITACTGLNYWYYTHIEKIDYTMAIAIFVAQIGYAGYQVTQIRKDIMNKVGVHSPEGAEIKEQKQEENHEVAQ